ncbi:selenoprotein S [Gracilinanus agilis]|uniref:selenoprotein S n=1 Tax=Gracilinanus agilis TaxID=191870 RepID=UPI001CFD0226|nr:selenoprotein S [Gracilinanus agilis]
MELEEEEQLLAKPAWELEGIQFLQNTVGWLLSSYGWYFLFSFVLLYLIFQRLFGSLRVARQRALDESVASNIEPEAVVKQQEALAASRLRMQEELNTQAEKYKEKLKQLEEEKRKQKIEMWESMQEGKSYKGNAKKWPQEPEPGPSTSSTITKPKSDKKPLRGNGYNPLTGEGSGTCSWRPGRRGPSSGG